MIHQASFQLKGGTVYQLEEFGLLDREEHFFRHDGENPAPAIILRNRFTRFDEAGTLTDQLSLDPDESVTVVRFPDRCVVTRPNAGNTAIASAAALQAEIDRATAAEKLANERPWTEITDDSLSPLPPGRYILLHSAPLTLDLDTTLEGEWNFLDPMHIADTHNVTIGNATTHVFVNPVDGTSNPPGDQYLIDTAGQSTEFVRSQSTPDLLFVRSPLLDVGTLIGRLPEVDTNGATLPTFAEVRVVRRADGAPGAGALQITTSQNEDVV